MSEPPFAVGVVIPARDEVDLVAACVDSVLAARLPAETERWVVVVADRCADDTAEVARRRLGRHGQVCLGPGGSVGAARAVGAAIALRRLVRPRRPIERTWLLTTDADSTVPRDWTVAHLRHAEAGAMAVAGTVTVASFDEHPSHVEGIWAERYALAGPRESRRQVDPHRPGEAPGPRLHATRPRPRPHAPAHPHVHGANLGVRADVYLEVGGWRPLVTGEDHDLWDRVRASGRPVTSTMEVPVVTSGRRRGRAPAGFADLLTSLGGRAP
ncbi:glycosyltransferase [soil metagenome]